MLPNQSNLLPKYGNFKRRKLEICTNLPKILSLQFHKFSLKCGHFSEIFQKVPLTMLLGTFFQIGYSGVEAFLERHILLNTVIAPLCAYILM
jgi:hypothetical protein